MSLKILPASLQERPRASQQRCQRHSNATQNEDANHPSTYRLGILCMILCFALGIANIITIWPLIIIFSIICLYVSRAPA